MNKRLLAGILVCVAVTALVVGAVGCGSGATTTTTAAQPATTTTAMPTSTTSTAASVTTSTAAPTTTSSSGPAASSTTISVQLSPAMQQYRTELLAFGQALMSLPEGDPTSVSDVNKVTSADLEAATAFVTAMHSALDKLKAIKPPAEIATAHQKLVDAITSLVAATDKSMQALQDKDQAALVAAQSDASALSEQILALLGELQTQLGSLQL